MSPCTYLHRWNVTQNNVWKNGMCSFLTSLMLECVLNCKTLHECALLESNVVVSSWWTNETKMSPNKKDVTCLILRMWEKCMQNIIYIIMRFIIHSCLLTFQFLFLSHCLLLSHLHLLVGLVLNYVAFVSCEWIYSLP